MTLVQEYLNLAIFKIKCKARACTYTALNHLMSFFRNPIWEVVTQWKRLYICRSPERAHCTRAVPCCRSAETLYRLMRHGECDRTSEESIPRPATHTDKPAVIALLHDADEISLLQLQLVLVLRHVAVQSLETRAGHEHKLVNLQRRGGMWNQYKKKRGSWKWNTDLTHIPQLRRGSGLLLWDWGCWEMMRDCLLGWGCSLWTESWGWWDRVLQYLTEVSAIFKISLHTAS